MLRKHPDVGMVVPRQVVAGDHPYGRAHVPSATTDFEIDVNISAHHDNILDPGFDPVEGLIEVSYAPLFCGLIPADVLAEIGPLDADNGPHYRSDWIFCDALRGSHGRRIVYTPYSKVYHLQGVATRAQRAAAATASPG